MTSSSSKSAGRLEVVLGDEAAVVLDAAHQLLELQQDQPAVGAELDDVALDLLGDAAHHLGPLQHGDDVADGHEVLDLERRQRAAHRVEPVLVALRGSAAPGRPGPAPAAIGSSVCFSPPRWTATSDMSSDTVITGTSIWRATRSAVRWRVPVSEVGHVGVGDEVDVGPGDARRVGRRG